MVDNKQLAVAMIQTLRKDLNNIKFDSDKASSAEVAITCLQELYEVTEQDISQTVLSISISSTKGKKINPVEAPSNCSRKIISDEDKAQAEAYKIKGNELLASKSYAEALKEYSLATELDPFNHIYWSNKAAAKTGLGDHEGAFLDAQESVQLCPEYTKGWMRVGSSSVLLGKESEAREAFERVLKLDPSNEKAKTELDRLSKSTSNANNSSNGGNLFGNLPNGASLEQMARQFMQNNPQALQGLAQMMQNTNGGSGGAGGNGLADLLNSPMAQQLMQALGRGQQQSSPKPNASVAEQDE